MKVIHDDLWLCVDCLFAAVNGDYTGLDYHYDPEEAEKRMLMIQEGLERLGPHLVPDFSEDGVETFSRRSCDCCGTSLAGSRHRFAVLGPEGVK